MFVYSILCAFAYFVFLVYLFVYKCVYLHIQLLINSGKTSKRTKQRRLVRQRNWEFEGRENMQKLNSRRHTKLGGPNYVDGPNYVNNIRWTELGGPNYVDSVRWTDLCGPNCVDRVT